MSSRKQNAVVMLVVAIIFLAGARFVISDPASDTRLHFLLPITDDIPLFSCPFYSVTGLPCPICGITRSSAAVMRGDVIGSFRSHPLGPFLALWMILAVPYSLFILIRPERGNPVKENDPHPDGSSRMMVAVLILIVIAWGINLARHFQIIAW